MTNQHRNFDLAHREIDKAYDAFGSDRADPPSSADRIIVVLDLVLQRMNGGNGKWGKVKRQGPTLFGGAGLGAVLLKALETLL